VTSRTRSWCRTPATCTTTVSTTTTNTASANATVTVVPLGTITIVKRTAAPTTRTFSFSFGSETFDLGADGTRTITGVTPGTYTVTEATTTGWLLSTLACVDPTGDSVATVSERAASIVVAPGETVTCTFTNGLSGSGGGTLPATGSDGLGPTLVAGAALVGLGVLLRVGWRRRRPL